MNLRNPHRNGSSSTHEGASKLIGSDTKFRAPQLKKVDIGCAALQFEKDPR